MTMERRSAVEGIHGVDVSWLHHRASNKDPRPASKTSSSSNTPLRDLSPSAPLNSLQGTRDGGVNPKLESNGSLKQAESVENLSHTSRRSSSRSRTNSDKLNPTTTDTADPTSKRPTWIRSLSSKFSSSQSPASNSPPNTQAKRAPSPSPAKPPRRETTSTFPEDGDDEHEEVLEPYVPQHPKGSSFFSSALRRLSSSAPSAATKSSSSGFVCPRQTLNVDKGRERCQIKDLDQKKLRRVAFSVDVEVAGVSRYMDEQSSTDTATKLREKKIKERSEGEALKTSHRPTGQHATGSEDSVIGNQERKDSGTSIDDIFENEMMAAAKQHETDAVNKRRIEKQDARRRSSEDALAAAAEAKTALGQNGAAAPTVKQPKPMAYPPRPQDRPTIDPLRMYRRCCQLREAPVLKRISEQLGASKPLEYETPGVVEVLDLNSSRMQLNDIICLADWLAIVPVKKLLLDHAGVTDESLRVVLAGLLAVKPPGFNKRKRETSSPTRHHEQKPNRTPGVIEKLSLKGNVKITAIGWKHLFLFMNMSRSIRSLDMSLTSFASSPAEASTLADLMYRSLVSRLGGSRFEELILSSCKLTSEAVCKIADAATVIGLNRLGLAKSQLDHKALHCIAKYIESGKCIGLDIGANDLGDPKSIMILTATLTSTNPFMYLSLANCNMSPASLDQLLPPLRVLPDFRFLDLSHNREIFTEHARALATLRKYIVQLRSLRRLHLVDVAMSPAQAIGIAEILPEVRNLNHISFMENPEIKALASATDLASQEDACALYASIMVACRVSKTLLAVDIDSPNAEANEVVSAMAKQVIAYCLRNVGRYTAADAMSSSDPASVIPDAVDPSLEVQQPDVLAHIVGDSNGSYPRQDGQGEIGPDQDYIVGGTGVVKALNYVLGQQTQDLRRVSLVNGPLDANSPIMDPSVGKRKARELSKSLLNSARQIRTRLHPAMLREAKKGDEMASRRLQFLDTTLQGIIERFEEEFPDCRVPQSTTARPFSSVYNNVFFNEHMKEGNQSQQIAEAIDEAPISPTRSRASSIASTSDDAGSFVAANSTALAKALSTVDEDNNDARPSAARRSSQVSTAARAQATEEGYMHRLGQQIRRDILPPAGMDDHLHSTSIADPAEASHLAALRTQFENLESNEIRDKVVKQGLEATVREFSENAATLKRQSMVMPLHTKHLTSITTATNDEEDAHGKLNGHE